MMDRYLLGDTLLWQADIYWGTHYYDEQLFIGGHIVTVGRPLLEDTLL